MEKTLIVIDVHANTNVADRMARALLDQIMTQKFSAGQALPSERELMRQFNVSRLACREALAKLRGMGIIESHHGKGTYLANTDELSVTPVSLELLQSQGHISNDDILEARLIIEPSGARLAASRADSSHRRLILDQANTQGDSFEGLSVVEYARHFSDVDIAFHQSVAAASGNPVLPMLLKSMHELLLRIRLEVLILQPDIVVRAMADHKKIAAAIDAADPITAARAMENHIQLRGKELLKGKN